MGGRGKHHGKDQKCFSRKNYDTISLSFSLTTPPSPPTMGAADTYKKSKVSSTVTAEVSKSKFFLYSDPFQSFTYLKQKHLRALGSLQRGPSFLHLQCLTTEHSLICSDTHHSMLEEDGKE